MTRLVKGLKRGEDGVVRCWWCGDDPLYIRYHDEEWGVLLASDQRLFEKLCLEGFQAGLSWITILRKRENFRAAFNGFRIDRVAKLTRRDVDRLLGDAGIVRHRGKIESVINNAARMTELLAEHGSFAGFLSAFRPDEAARPRRVTHAALSALSQTAESKALSRELRGRGFTYVGPTTMYAFMQSVGLVNDHLHGCEVRERVAAAASSRRRPGRG